MNPQAACFVYFTCEPHLVCDAYTKAKELLNRHWPQTIQYHIYTFSFASRMLRYEIVYPMMIAFNVLQLLYTIVRCVLCFALLSFGAQCSMYTLLLANTINAQCNIQHSMAMKSHDEGKINDVCTLLLLL